MINSKSNNANGERGNALFLILIAVALFAALSWAVTQSGRGGGSVSTEQAQILASQITQYPASVRTSVTRMMVTGTAATALDFTTTPTNSATTEVFGATGGQAIVQTPPTAATTATAWSFLPTTGATNGWYIWNVGTNTQNSGREAIAVLPNLTSAVCQQINKGLGLATTPVTDATVISLTVAGTTAPAATTTSFVFNSNPAATAGVQYAAFACIENGTGTGNYTYYHALVEQ